MNTSLSGRVLSFQKGYAKKNHVFAEEDMKALAEFAHESAAKKVVELRNRRDVERHVDGYIDGSAEVNVTTRVVTRP